MNHVIEVAPSSRAACRTCGQKIARGELRFGEAVPSSFGSAGFTHEWHHLACAAAKKPAQLRPTLAAFAGEVPGREALLAAMGAPEAGTTPAPPDGTPAPQKAPPAPEKPEKKATREKSPAAPESDPPAFDQLDGKKLRALGKKLDATFDPNGFKHRTIVEKAGVPWNRRAALYWHLAEHRLIAPETNVGLLLLLSTEVAAAPRGVIVPLLGRLTTPFRELYRNYSQGEQEILPRWTNHADLLAVHALCHEREALEAAMDSFPDSVRLGVSFVRGRSGMTIRDPDRQEVIEQLAKTALNAGQCASHLIQIVKGDTVEPEPFYLMNPAELPRVVALLGASDEAWGQLLARGLKKGAWTRPSQVAAGLARVSLADLVALLGNRSYFDDDPATIFAILDARPESTAQVIATARSLPSGYDAGSTGVLREMMLAWGLSRAATRGEPVDPDAASDLSLELFPRAVGEQNRVAMREAYLAALRATPRPVALALARRQLATEYEFAQGAPVLAAHFDDALLREFLAREDNRFLSGKLFALIGVRALPALVDAFRAASSASQRETAIGGVIAVIAAGEGPLGPEEQAAVEALASALVEIADDRSYWSQEGRDLVGRVLGRLPTPVRRKLLLAKLAEATHASRPLRFVPLEKDRSFRVAAMRLAIARAAHFTEDDFEVTLRLLGEDAPTVVAEAMGQDEGPPAFLRKLETALGPRFAAFAAARGLRSRSWYERLEEQSAEIDGARERIYLLEPPHAVGGLALSPRPGSWSRLGGPGPGVAAPQLRGGAPMDHVLTLDLHEVPELARRYPDARALSLFVPDARGGEKMDGSQLVAVPEAAGAPRGGEPLFVLPVEVPSAVFDPDKAAASALLGELRKAIFHRAGWALGQPMWIQDEESGGELVMQLADALGLNLGDSGALYVFASSAVAQSF